MGKYDFKNGFLSFSIFTFADLKQNADAPDTAFFATTQS